MTTDKVINSTWTKHTYSCGHWMLRRTPILEESRNGGWPIGGKHGYRCSNCELFGIEVSLRGEPFWRDHPDYTNSPAARISRWSRQAAYRWLYTKTASLVIVNNMCHWGCEPPGERCNRPGSGGTARILR